MRSWEMHPDNGAVYRMTPYQGLENRIFGKDFEFEDAEKYYQFCTAIPVGTLLAQTFDDKLLEECGEMIASEMEEFGITLWLAPGMNIHRNPLCGRNFEYYSEDPLVSGMCAAAITRGVQRTKGHTANSKDLCTRLAREEWGFKGIIMTDWTTTNSDGGSSAAKCIAAGNDLIMPGNSHDVHEIIDAVNHAKDQKLAMEDLDACCDRILEMILKSNRYTTDEEAMVI